MLISKPAPAATWSLIQTPMGAGDWSFVGSPARLTQGRPRLKTRIVGPDATDLPLYQADFARPYVPVLFACISRGPTTASPSLSVWGRPTGSSEFSLELVPTGAAPFLTMDDQTLSAIFLTENTVEVDALRFGVGPAENTGSTAHMDVGQLGGYECFRYTILRDWNEHRENLAEANITKSAQPFPRTNGGSLRVASVTVAPVPFSKTIGSGDTLQQLQASLSNSRPVLAVPFLRGPGLGDAAPIDQEAVARSALFGYCDQLGKIGDFQGAGFSLSLRFREAPGTPTDEASPE